MQNKQLNIRSIEHLALRLGIPVVNLIRISKSANRMYGRIEIPKKNGNVRVIEPPRYKLKQVQKRISHLLGEIEIPSNIHSYQKGKSIKTNTLPHVGNHTLLKTDIKDFYPSITNKAVYDLFISFGCTPDVSRILTRLTTKDGHLPQGAPTSPVISNLVISRISKRVQKIIEKHGFTATFYGDDIAISGGKHVKKFKKLFEKIIRQEGYMVAADKEVVFGPDDEKEVTGVSIGKKSVSATKKYCDEVEKQIEKGFGTEKEMKSIKSKLSHIKWLDEKKAKDLINKNNFPT